MSSTPNNPTDSQTQNPRKVNEIRRVGQVSIKIKKAVLTHLKFLGPGMVAATNFLDPGNVGRSGQQGSKVERQIAEGCPCVHAQWATDLQAGSQFGNVHLFTIFVAIACAVVLQILACKLGCVSGQGECFLGAFLN